MTERRMTILSFFSRKTSAPVARERLQILLAHERASMGHPDLLSLLREEILAVVAKHVEVERDRIQVTMNRGDDVQTLEIDIELPAAMAVKVAARA